MLTNDAPPRYHYDLNEWYSSITITKRRTMDLELCVELFGFIRGKRIVSLHSRLTFDILANPQSVANYVIQHRKRNCIFIKQKDIPTIDKNNKHHDQENARKKHRDSIHRRFVTDARKYNVQQSNSDTTFAA